MRVFVFVVLAVLVGCLVPRAKACDTVALARRTVAVADDSCYAGTADVRLVAFRRTVAFRRGPVFLGDFRGGFRGTFRGGFRRALPVVRIPIPVRRALLRPPVVLIRR
jgi:hypothetical protein